MSDIIFADGAHYERRTDKMPEFIVGRLSFNVDTFIEFLQKHKNDRGYVNLDIKTGKSGKDYLSLNVWKKPEALTEHTVQKSKITADPVEYPEEEINAEDIPF